MNRPTKMRSKMDYYERLCTIPEFTEEYRSKRDPLKKLLMMSFTPRCLPMKVLFTLACFVYISSILMDIYILLSTLEYENLLKYGAFLGVQIFLVENLWILFRTYDQIFIFGKEIYDTTFAFELVDSEALTEFSRMVTIVKLVTCINYFLAVCTSVGLGASQDILNEKIYSRVWTCQNFSATTCSIAGYLQSCLDVPVIMSTVSIPFIMVYYEILAIVHVDYMNEAVKTVCKTCLPEKELYTSEIFQRIVCNKLKICIVMHEKLISLCIKGTSIIYTPVLFISIGSLILGSSMLLFILSTDLSQMNLFFFALMTATVNYLICVWLYIYFSQLLINESEYTRYLLIQIPWYYMNESNRKLYSVFLLKTGKPLNIQTNVLEVNYLLVVRIFKSLYSVAAIIMRFQPSIGENKSQNIYLE